MAKYIDLPNLKENLTNFLNKKINPIYAKKTEIPHGTVVDDALSSTSTNPVQNKVVKAEFDKVNSNLDVLEFGEVAGGKNLFDKNSSENVDGWLINGIPNGENTYNQKTSHFIRIDGNTFVYNKGNVNNQIAFYDSNRAFINQIHQNDGTNIVEIPTNAKYVRVVYFDGEKDLVQIEKGTTATDYEPYIPSVKMLAEEVNAQNESLADYGLDNKAVNLLQGYYDVRDGSKYNSSKYLCTEKLAVSQGQTIKVIAEKTLYGIHFVLFNEDTYVSSITTVKSGDVLTVPSGVTKVGINFSYNADVSPNTSGHIGVYIDNAIDELKNDLSNLKDGTTPAAKAVADEDENNIKSTYAKKTELDAKANITDPVFTGSFSQNRKAGSTIGTNSHAEGSDTESSGGSSHAEGSSTTASGESSHAEGFTTTASGTYSHAEGVLTTASGKCSHSEGYSTTASKNYSHAEGASTTASGDSSHTEGNCASATGDFSHAEGNWTIASGESSHAEGDNTIASNYSSHASGKLNASMTTGGTFDNTTGTAFVIGNGTSEEALSNAFSVQYDGTVKAKSTITASTTADYAEFFEWLDENPNNEDRVGYFVTLDGNRIKIASDNDDYILGIVSGEPFVLGNGDCDTWNGMYLHDEFRRTIYEPAPKVEKVEIKEEREETYIDEETGEEKIRTVEVVVGHEFKEVEGEFDGTRPKLNPEYDNTQPYVSRFDRKEWSPVGMLGVLAVRHDGTAKVNGYVTVNKNGIATACDKNIENSYRVIKANTDSVVEIVFR